MNIADRIRLEKREKVGTFDAVHFMELVETYFKSHGYGKELRLRSGDTYIRHPSICDGTLYFQVHEKLYSTLDSIEVPIEYLDDAKALLMDEGFYLYEGEDETLIKLEKDPLNYVRIGVHYYYLKKQ